MAQTQHPVGTMMRKMRTQVLDRKAVDFMVLQFSAHDDSMLNTLGKHNKECRWKIQASLESPLLDIVVAIDKSLVGKPQVNITCDTEQVFPPRDSNSKHQVLREDFEMKWPFRGSAKGINEKNWFEIRPATNNVEQWFPATITKQRDDGRFEALVEMPNGTGGVNQVKFDALKKEDIREASSKKPLNLPERFFVLMVPMENPLLAEIKIDGTELVTHYFARPTPVPRQTHCRSKITCKVDKDRRKVNADIGHVALSRFLSMEPRAVKSEPGTLRHAWTVQIGPWAQHRIEIEKRHKRSKAVTITVDGEVLVEATADDIECSGEDGSFDCRFSFRGQRCIDYEVHETNKDGEPLSTKATVSQKQKFTVDVVVTMPDDKNLHTTELFLDGVNFKALTPVADEHTEENLSIDVQAMQMSFGLNVPFKVNKDAPSGLLSMTAKAQDAAGSVGGFFSNLFGGSSLLEGCCKGTCNRGNEITRDIVEPPVPKY